VAPFDLAICGKPAAGHTTPEVPIEINRSDFEIISSAFCVMAGIKKSLNQILHHHTKKTMKSIQVDTDRDFFMSAEQAKDYGVIDEIIEHRLVHEKVKGK
jgi:ATP-dependent protease ClpP protease subunit